MKSKLFFDNLISELDLSEIYKIVDVARNNVYSYLRSLRDDAGYTEKLETAFGNDFHREVANQLFDSFAQGYFSDIPSIKIVKRDDINGANGAFSRDTNLIYLASEFITENANNPQAITDVLLEETGHFVDAQINTKDAAGDEGDIFARLVEGDSLSQQELAVLRAEDDTATVTLDGQVVQIEQNFTLPADGNNLRWNLKQINVFPAWQKVTGTGKTIAIIDSGVSNHTGFGSRVVNPYNFVGNNTTVTDSGGHGTQVASAALANYSTSNVFGVAPDANLMPLKVTTQSGTYSAEAVIKAFEWAINNKADVINTSFGFKFDNDDQKARLKNLINKARNLNIIVTVAAGNYGQDWSAGWLNPTNSTLYPTFKNTWAEFLALNKFSNVIVVGATNETGRIADLSNYNSQKLNQALPVHIAAPSGDGSLDTNSIKVLTNTSSTAVTQVTGTSFSAPEVAGAVALIKQYYQGLTYEQIKRFLLSTVNKDQSDIPTEVRHPDMQLPNPNASRSLKTGMVSEGSLNVANIFNRYVRQNTITINTSTSTVVAFYGIKDTTTNTWVDIEVGTLPSPANVGTVSNLSRLSVSGASATTTNSTTQTSSDFSSFSSLLTVGGTGANVSMNGNIMTINGVISAAIGGVAEYSLFRVNNLAIDLSQGPVATFTEAAGALTNGFTLLGLNVQFNKFELQEKSIKLSAKLTAPELGILDEAALNIDAITISTDGLSVGQASFTPWTGKKEFNAFGLMKVALENPTLGFNFQEEVGTLQGKLYIPTLNNLTVDLSGNKGLKFRQAKNGSLAEYALDVSIQNGVIPIYGDWKLDNISVRFTKSFDATTITGSLGANLYTSQNKFITGGGTYNKVQVTDKNAVFAFTAKSEVGTDFSAFGTDIDIRTIKFVSDRNPTDDNYWDPKSTLTDGYITLPELFGKNDQGQRIQVALKDLDITKDGFSLGGATVSLPDFTVNLLGLPKLKAIGTGIKLEYAKDPNKIVINASGQNVAEEYFKIQGTLQLPNFYYLTANFSGSNYIKISNNSANSVEVVGTFSAENVNLAEGWTIKHAELGISTTNKIVTAKGTLIIPSGVEIGADVIFDNGVLTYADIKADHLNKPIGTTGAYLKSIKGRYEAVNTSFGGTVGITAGAEINLNLPSWAGGGIHGSLVELDASATITSSYFKTKGNITVLGGLIKGNGDTEINWANKGKEYLWATSNFTILNGLITTQTQFLATSKLDLYMFGEAIVKVPDFIPFLGGKYLGSGEVYVEYTNDGISSNDYVAAWGNVGLLGTVGIKVSLDGNYHVMWYDEANAIAKYAKETITEKHKLLVETKPIYVIGDAQQDVSADGINIDGTDGNDNLHGDNNQNTINGKKGDDLLLGEGGNDILYGNENKDLLHGGDGDDFLYGDGGNDILYGDKGYDELYGGDGDDNLYGNDNDYLVGNDGNDYLFGGGKLYGGKGSDILTTSYAFAKLDGAHAESNKAISEFDNPGDSDTVSYSLYTENLDISLNEFDSSFGYTTGLVYKKGIASSQFQHVLASIENAIGGTGDDSLSGNSQNNRLEGGEGNDTLKGGAGQDTLEGGAGNDTYIILDSITDTIIENPAEGTDTVQSSVTFSIADIANVENLTLTGTSAINGTGNAANNIITGNSGNNILNGGAGDDTLNLGYNPYSTDIVDGGDGTDLLQVDYSSKSNGVGIHLGYNGEYGTNVIYHRNGNNGDSYKLVQFSSIERFDITGTQYADAFEGRDGNDIFRGGAGSDILNGGAGNDTLDGGAGSDTFNGGAGDDTYIVDSITDVITENANEGIDTIQSSVTFRLANLPNIENLTLTGTAAINGTGNAANNVITGNSGNNILNGGAGDDTLNLGYSPYSTDTVDGGEGDDLLQVDYSSKNNGAGIHLGYNNTDRIYHRAGTVGDSFELVQFSNIERFDITGTKYADAFEGRTGNDIFSGGDGNDILNGGGGNDILNGDDTAATAGFSAAFTAFNNYSPAQGWNSFDQYPRQLADVNGDGRADIVGFGASGVSVALGQTDGKFVSSNILFNDYTTGWSNFNTMPRQVADVNGDGRADIVGFGSNAVYVAFGKDNGTFETAFSAFNNYSLADGWNSFDQYPRQVADVNGDGRADIVGFGAYGVSVALGQTSGQFVSTDLLFNDYTSGWSNFNIMPRQVADVNGDGRADIVGFGSSVVKVALGQANGTFGTAFLASNYYSPADGWNSFDQYPRQLADVNGDGRADIVGFGALVSVALGQADGTFGSVNLVSNDYTTGWSNFNIMPRQVADVNGDGRADIVGFGSNAVYVALANNSNDILNGGAGNDTLTGGTGKDTLTGGTESDRFDYRNLADSLLNSFDVITDFNANAGNDLFLVSTTRSGFSNAGIVATLSATGIAANLTTANFGSNSATQFTFSGRTFVAINDATAGFNANSDAIIEVTGLTGTLTASNFIVDDGGVVGISVLAGGDTNGVFTGGFTNNNSYNKVHIITGTPGRDTLIGNPTSDRITGLQGADTITGGDGNDEFVYTNIRDNGDTITDFEVGKDHIVFTQLLDSLVTGGYNGANAIADGYVKVVQGTSTSNFSVQIDADGSTGDDIFRPFITVNLAGTGTLNNPSNFVF